MSDQTSGFFVHPKGTVDEGASVGAGTRVWANAHVMAGAQVGKGCNLGETVFVEAGARVGDDVTIKNGVHVWEGVEVGDKCFLGPNATFTNDLWPRSWKRPKESWLKGTVLEEAATLGANVTIVAGVRIGRYAMVGAGAVVTRDVPAHALVYGNPARVRGWVCRCGPKLSVKAGKATCDACGTRYALKGKALQEISAKDAAAPAKAVKTGGRAGARRAASRSTTSR